MIIHTPFEPEDEEMVQHGKKAVGDEARGRGVEKAKNSTDQERERRHSTGARSV